MTFAVFVRLFSLFFFSFHRSMRLLFANRSARSAIPLLHSRLTLIQHNVVGFRLRYIGSPLSLPARHSLSILPASLSIFLILPFFLFVPYPSPCCSVATAVTDQYRFSLFMPVTGNGRRIDVSCQQHFSLFSFVEPQHQDKPTGGHLQTTIRSWHDRDTYRAETVAAGRGGRG